MSLPSGSDLDEDKESSLKCLWSVSFGLNSEYMKCFLFKIVATPIIHKQVLKFCLMLLSPKFMRMESVCLNHVVSSAKVLWCFITAPKKSSADFTVMLLFVQSLCL